MELIHESLTGRPWDYEYLRRLEKCKLLEMRDYFQQADITTKETYKNILRWINVAIKMLNILEHSDRLFHFEGDVKWGTDGLDLSELKYHCDIKVNLRNSSRFISNSKDLKYIKNNPHELYLRKAKHIYHLIRENYEESWWD